MAEDVALKEIADAETLRRAEALYLGAFPPEERRDWRQIADGSCGLTIRGIYVGGVFAGIVTTWQFPEFVYVEHLAIEPSMRGAGIGREVVEQLCREAKPLPLALEAEPEDMSEMASRRIRFYRRCGLEVIDKTYVQPPYSEGLPSVGLWLMASGDVSPDLVIRQLYERVYGRW